MSVHFVLGYKPDEVPKTLRARQPRGASADSGRVAARRIRSIVHAMGGGLGAWLALAAPADSAVFCTPYTADGGGGPIAPPVICTETAANGLVASSSEPFQTAGVPPLATTYVGQAPGASEIVGVGTGGVSGHSTSSGAFGRLDVRSEADNGQFTTPVSNFLERASVATSADAMFVDFGVFESATLPAGTAVAANAIVSVTGAYGTAGGGFLRLFVYDATTSQTLWDLVGSNPIFFAGNPGYDQTVALAAHVGDEIRIWVELHSAAMADNDAFNFTALGAADITATLRIEVATSDVTFAAASGHDYQSVPEPGAALLFPVAALSLAVLRRLRAS